MNESKTNTVENTSFYITEGGMKVYYKPMSFLKRSMIQEGLLKEYHERGEPLDVPKVEMEVFGGDMIEQELSQETLIVEGNEEETAKRQKLWQDHIDATNRYNKELKEAEDELLMSAIEVDLPEDESWIVEQKRLHIQIPDDLHQRRIHYIQTEVLTSMEDLVELTSLIFTKSAVRSINAEDLAIAKDSFRNKIFGVFERENPTGNGIKEPENTTEE